MATNEQAKGVFLDAYTRMSGTEPGWLAKLRSAGAKEFEAIGFPSRKDEDWKYTSVAPLLEADLNPTVAASKLRASKIKAAVLEAAGDAPVLVFVDGFFDAAHSRVEVSGARICGLAQAVEAGDETVRKHLGKYLDPAAHGFAALNTAFIEDGAVVVFERGKKSETVHILHIAAGRPVSNLRNLFVAEPGSQGTIVQHWVSAVDGAYLTSAANEVVIDRARLAHVSVQRESRAAFHVGRTQVKQLRDAHYASHAVALGAALSRSEIYTELAATGAACELYGLSVIGGDRHADHHTVIDHAAPHTQSTEQYKAILDDTARGVFTGRVVVRPDAQKISASQTNNNLLLGERAVAETRPQLEIYADDVKCNHGATIGRLDDDALFYMRQRGIGPRQARRLLTVAFAGEIIERLPDEHLREGIETSVRRYLKEARA